MLSDTQIKVFTVFLNDNKSLSTHGLTEVGTKSMRKIVHVSFIEYWLRFNIARYFCTWMFSLSWTEKLTFPNLVKGNCQANIRSYWPGNTSSYLPEFKTESKHLSSDANSLRAASRAGEKNNKLNKPTIVD